MYRLVDIYIDIVIDIDIITHVYYKYTHSNTYNHNNKVCITYLAISILVGFPTDTLV